MQVDYSEESWRAKLRADFNLACSELERPKVLHCEENIRLGAEILNWIAESYSLTAKQENWKAEQEIRRIVLVDAGADLQPRERDARSGKRIRYIEVPVRRSGKRIALAEVIIGPNQYGDLGRQKVTQILHAAGYTPGDAEYPEISISDQALSV
jgi:hypothetical protein